MIARKSSLIIGSELLDGLLAYVAIFFIARYMAPGDYGIIGFAMGFIGLFTIVNSLGFDEAHIKRISEGKDLGTCIGTFIVTKISLVSLMALLSISAVFIWKFVLGRGFETPQHEIAIYIILGYYVLERLTKIFQTTYTAETKIAKTYIPKLLSTIVRTFTIIFVAVFADRFGFDAITLAEAYVFGHLILFLSALFLFRKYPIKKPSKQCFKEYIQFALPLFIVGASGVILTNIDKVILQLFWSAEYVGYYYACFRISGFIIMAGTGLGLILFPTFSNYYGQKNLEAIKQIMYQAERYIFMLTLPIVIGVVVLAEPAIHIMLSDHYYPAIPAFQLLPFYSLFYALTIPYNAQLLGMNKPNLARNRIIVMVVLNLVLNLILIPKDIQSLGVKLPGLGITGAAIASVLSYLVGLIYYRLSARKLIQLKFNFRLILHIIAGCIMGAVLYWIYHSHIIPIEKWYELALVGLIGLSIYFGFLTLFKEFTKKDFNLFLDTFNFKKMLNYIIKEIKRG